MIVRRLRCKVRLIVLLVSPLTIVNLLQLNESLNQIHEHQLKSELRIKVGVLRPAQRSNHNVFWIEFDPTVKGHLSEHSLRLPYLIVPTPFGGNSTVFYVNKRYPGCSSIYKTTLSGTCSVNGTILNAFRNACDYVSMRPNLFGAIKLWGKNSTVNDTMKISHVSLGCLNYCTGLASTKLPSISLADVLDLLPGTIIQLLDIDAQGADVGIVKSLQKYFSRIMHIQMECQLGTYFYQSQVTNDCYAARDFLIQNGFRFHELEVNNCGVLEFNLRMSNIQVQNVSHQPIDWDGG